MVLLFIYSFVFWSFGGSWEVHGRLVFLFKRVKEPWIPEENKGKVIGRNMKKLAKSTPNAWIFHLIESSWRVDLPLLLCRCQFHSFCRLDYICRATTCELHTQPKWLGVESAHFFNWMNCDRFHLSLSNSIDLVILNALRILLMAEILHHLGCMKPYK